MTGDGAAAQLAEARRAAADALMEQQARYGLALVARFGPGVVETIRETTIAAARAWTPPAPAEGVLAAVDAFWKGLPPEMTWEELERTDRTRRFRVSGCPFAERMRALGAPDLGLAYYCAYDHGFCAGLHPRLRFTRTQTLMQGDPCCDHAYMLEDAPPAP